MSNVCNNEISERTGNSLVFFFLVQWQNPNIHFILSEEKLFPGVILPSIVSSRAPPPFLPPSLPLIPFFSFLTKYMEAIDPSQKVEQLRADWNVCYSRHQEIIAILSKLIDNGEYKTWKSIPVDIASRMHNNSAGSPATEQYWKKLDTWKGMRLKTDTMEASLSFMMHREEGSSFSKLDVNEKSKSGSDSFQQRSMDRSIESVQLSMEQHKNLNVLPVHLPIAHKLLK